MSLVEVFALVCLGLLFLVCEAGKFVTLFKRGKTRKR
jgi:hypothetical protein